MEIAILAGGCFWGMEDLMRKIPCVQKTAPLQFALLLAFWGVSSVGRAPDF